MKVFGVNCVSPELDLGCNWSHHSAYDLANIDINGGVSWVMSIRESELQESKLFHFFLFEP